MFGNLLRLWEVKNTHAHITFLHGYCKALNFTEDFILSHVMISADAWKACRVGPDQRGLQVKRGNYTDPNSLGMTIFVGPLIRDIESICSKEEKFAKE